MKNTGIVRKVDNLGRIVLPKELRVSLNIDNGSQVELFVESDRIILKKYSERCYICGCNGDLIRFRNKNVCRKCIKEL